VTDGSRLEVIVSFVSNAGEAIRTRGEDVRDRAEQSIQQAKDRVELPIHRHPLETVLVSAGCGVLLGFVLGFLSGRNSR